MSTETQKKEGVVTNEAKAGTEIKIIFKKTIFVFLLLFSSFVYAHNDDSYYHDSGNLPNQQNWMSRLDNTKSIYSISMPGTHDSGARYGGDAVQTQSLTIRQQLDAGIRFLDIRLRHIDNKFTIHHGAFYQHMNFDDVLTQVRDFLNANKSETVLMRVKQEHTTENSTRSFADTFSTYNDHYQDIIYTPKIPSTENPNEPTRKLLITLNEVRGKLIFLQNFDEPSSDTQVARFGLNYKNFNIQDAFEVGSNWDLYGKWEKVKAQLNNANANRESTSYQGYMNYLSASGGSFPYFIASGHSNPATGAARLATVLTTPGFNSWYPDFPRVSCWWVFCTIAFEGTNTLTKDFINNNKHLKYVGIVIADFPGAGLITKTIDTNFR